MTLRSWRPGDDVPAALGPPPTWLEAQGRDEIGLPAGATVVAEHECSVVGVGSAYSSRWHPHRLWCYVEVAPGHRRGRHGTALLQALRARTDRPLRGKVIAGSAGAAFAQARGFRTLQRCRTLAVEARPDAPSPMDVDDDPPSAPAAEAFRAFYATTHGWDPLGDIAPGEFVASHLDDAVARFVVGDGLAVGCLYDEVDSLLLSGGPTRPGELAATEALVAAAARHAARAGRPLTAEVDDANESLARVLRTYGPVQLDETHIVVDG